MGQSARSMRSPSRSRGETVALLGPNGDGKSTAMRDLYPRPLPLAALLEQANLRDIARQKVNTLSGGQIQRVCFALAAVA